MKWFDRALIVVISVLGIIVALCFISVAVGWPLNEAALHGMAALAQNGTIRIILAVISIGVVLIGIRLLILGFGRGGVRDAVLVSSEDNGKTYVSREAICAIALRHCRENRSITDCKAQVLISKANDVTIRLNLFFAEGADVTTTCALLSQGVKSCVLGYCGLPIKEVALVIEGTREGGAAHSRVK